jgi:hypothetical protein
MKSFVVQDPVSQNRLLYVVLAITSLFFLVTRLNLPIELYPDASVDDGLFIALGKSLAAGDYLGAYGPSTLSKGPGYPLFLAMTHYSGLPISLTHALFFLVALLAFSLAVGHLFRSKSLTGVLFVVLCLHPVFLVDRVVREAIYTPQLFLLLALAVGLVWARGWTAVAYGGGAGAMFAWFWLTREEGLWIVPGLAVLCAVILLVWFTDAADLRRAKVRGAAAFLASATLGIVSFSMANWIYYGSFQGNDLKETNFSAAMQALQSVRDGDQIAFVPVSASTRRHIYSVSPAFSSLRPRLDPDGPHVPMAGCGAKALPCGDIAGAFFVWSLRSAAAKLGVMADPTRAKAFFRKLADEVNGACSDGRLTCRSNPIPLMPNFSREQLAAFWPTFWRTAVYLTESSGHRLGGPSTGSPQQRADALRLLNSPVIAPGAAESSQVFLIGFYVYNPSRPFVIGVLNAVGHPMTATVMPLDASSRTYRSDVPLSGPRPFHVLADCDGTCSVVIGAEKDGSITVPVSSLVGTIKKIKEHGYEVDLTAVLKRAVPTDGQAVAERVHAGLVAIYRVVLPIMLPLGFVAFLASLYLAWLDRSQLVAVGVAGCLWTLVASRLALITLIDISAFPTLNSVYLNTAIYLGPAAAIVSLACVLPILMRRAGYSAAAAPA